MYNTSDFLKDGQQKLDVHVQESSITDAIPHEDSTDLESASSASTKKISDLLKNYIYTNSQLHNDTIRKLISNRHLSTIKDYSHLFADSTTSTLVLDPKYFLTSNVDIDAMMGISEIDKLSTAHNILNQLEESKKLEALRIQEIINHNELLDKVRNIGQSGKPTHLKSEDDEDET